MDKKLNRLSKEKSPYLLQHAANPVDWYPWGEEALQASKKSGKPIFLSIGYSTCHWCHVMEHESFEDAATAEIMNNHYINIKVDREERPDLDHIYMTTVQMLTGSGGWPMSVWLTPELKPFYGGTYFPPNESYGRPGFKTVLSEIAQVWDKDNAKVTATADQITESVREAASAGSSGEKLKLDRADLFKHAFNQLEQSFDKQEGGFGRAPKFPMPGYLNFLLYYYAATNNEEALKMASFTMKKMAKGGLYDQLGGGFSRYSTDNHWLVPHFEKMLYDNAQLISVCVSLYQATHDEFFKDLCKNAIAYIQRDMTHKEGGFYSAEDADSEGKEGTFYLWTLGQVKELLGPALSELFISYFPVTANGNFFDPHTEEIGKNILALSRDINESDKKFIDEAKATLFAVRSKRIRPHLDDKIITEWNGLMISGMARAGAVFGEKIYVEAAERAASFIKKNLFDASSNVLYRRWRDSDRKIEGLQADYAALTQGIIDLFEASGDPQWLEWAGLLHARMNELFSDEKNGSYIMSRATDLLFPVREDSDNVMPSGSSLAILNGIRLGRLCGRTDWLARAQVAIESLSRAVKIHPPAFMNLLTALWLLEKDPPQVVVVGSRDESSAKSLIQTAHRPFKPGKVVLSLSPGVFQERLAKINPAFSSMRLIDGKVAAYVCVDFSCQAPTTEAAELDRQLLDR